MDGIVLGNRYELLEKIGEGGMSEVFKARCNKLNRFVAVKVLKKEFCNNPDIVEKFKGEATAIATLSDNNIVNILDVGTQDDINYIVMEYVKGKTLKDIIKQVGKMNYETAISVAIQIAKALDCAHRNNIIHRDVKPQNILVTEDGVMKVTDFGIAKSTTSETITNTSTIMGSAHYLSPEQAKGSFIDCRTDLYSLGVVLYEMVTGTLPFQADSAVTIALKHLQEEVVPPKNLNSKVPDSLNQLILKSMQKDPVKRYESAKEMIADLQKIKDDPNAKIDKEEDNDHTIIMSAVTSHIPKQDESTNKQKKDDEYDDEDDDYYYEDDDEKVGGINKGRIMKIIIGAVLLCILVGIGVTAFKMFSSSAPSTKEVQVPNVVGKNLDDAKKELEALKLVLVEGGTEASDEPQGTVIKMNKEAGSMVKENSEVRVIVSGGATKLKMPDVQYYDIDAAKTILNSLGLKISDQSESFSDNVPKGQIISQSPKKDTEITTDDKITVVVSKGPEIKLTTVPSVKGLDSDAAKGKLEDAKLKVAIVTQETQNESENGIVLAQSIEGSKVEQGTSVTITIGKYVAKQEPTTPTPGNTKPGGTTTPDKTPGTTPGPGGTAPTTGTTPTGPWDDVTTNQNNTTPNKTSNQNH
ncbi:Stk1 family PASTA domain-containing Ser/Thr kinase [Clostridium chromiireducens]|uniref:non-specific serine/threonine protein kinase n=1 Tax=Clostridium chromiireducens TaxID=225345 RepID=A0A1V4J1L3_9CLOT|nr:Stk1 family PASTA domain-containing Ser/Thr kinase [Clostridium chromiireducens]OPJ65547.1 serine/threonine-protein kinase PrkC [Clostridium chromiireducens]